MKTNHAGENSSSRFSVRLVRTSHQSAMAVDPGCQRCQHCTLRRFMLHAAITNHAVVDKGGLGMIVENQGDQQCR